MFQAFCLYCCGWRRAAVIDHPPAGAYKKGLAFAYYRPVWYRDTPTGRDYFAGEQRLDIWVNSRKLCRTLRGTFAESVFNTMLVPLMRQQTT